MGCYHSPVAGTLDRRSFLRGTAAALLAWPRRAPAVVTPEAHRPRLEQGVASGDVTPLGAVVWSRTDRPAAIEVAWSLDPRFSAPHAGARADALMFTDYTAHLALTGLPAGREIHYRVRAESLDHRGAWSEPLVGSFRTPGAGDQPVRFAWSGDVCGQGYGINPAFGGLRIFEAIRRERPHLFIHCGDSIYADQPLVPRRTLEGGAQWHNLVTPAKSKVAESLDEFRGNFRYNLLCERLRRFLAEVPLVAMWDDHEVKNDWWPGRILTEDPRYLVKDCDLLAARARRAFFEYMPVAARWDVPQRIYRWLPRGPLLDVFVLDARSHRGPASFNHQREESPATAFFGRGQLDWLRERLAASTATWKLIASDQPIGLMIAHGPGRFEGIANGNGPPLGRELEIAGLLSFIKQKAIRNVVWVTADVHYAAAHHYQPQRARFTGFDPFWELVAGPLHAATYGPDRLDDTFGPEEVFCSVPRGMPIGRPPTEGRQFYGVGHIDPKTKALTVSLHDLEGRNLWSHTLEPR